MKRLVHRLDRFKFIQRDKSFVICDTVWTRIQYRVFQAVVKIKTTCTRTKPLVWLSRRAHALTTISWPLKSACPMWNGVMQMLRVGEHPGQSSFMFLPLIDLSSSDLSCIFSTLKFICAQAQIINSYPIVTFKQPLWIKALSWHN